MANWVFKGLASGVVTTRYPYVVENIPGAWPGLPEVIKENACPADCRKCREACLSNAITRSGPAAPAIDYLRCLFCRRCVESCPRKVIVWKNDFRSAVLNRKDTLPRRFSRRSVYIRHVDGGACESCLWEINGLSNPYYDLHRLGFFFVTSPRHADLLLVSGPVTQSLADALIKTYRAMPGPKLVIATGACACSVSFAGMNYATPYRLADLLPVDVFIPGCPPAPLTLLHGLLLATGRISEAPEREPVNQIVRS